MKITLAQVVVEALFVLNAVFWVSDIFGFMTAHMMKTPKSICLKDYYRFLHFLDL